MCAHFGLIYRTYIRNISLLLESETISPVFKARNNVRLNIVKSNIIVAPHPPVDAFGLKVVTSA